MTYAEWIREYESRNQDYVAGLCADATRRMVVAFPELKRVAGTAYSAMRTTEHWWCVAPDGTVVDPTARQFSGCGVVEYVPWKPGDEVRVGRCMNCGEDIYERVESLQGSRREICGETCEREMAAWINGEVTKYRSPA